LYDFINKTFLDNKVEDLLWFAGIVLGILLLSRWISRIMSFIIYRLFRRMSKESRLKQFSDMAQKPLSVFVVLFAAYLSFTILKYPGQLDFELHELPFSVVLMTAYRTLMVVVFTWLLIRLVNFIGVIFQERAEKTQSRADDQVVLFAKDMSKVLIVIIAIFFILGTIFRLNITSLLAGAGIFGLALAFAAKESIENFFGSLTIFADKPFSVGDLVQIGDVTGTVEKVGFRSTRIRTVDRTFVTIPNRTLNTDNTENLTLRTFRRVDTMIGVTYDSTAETIRNIVSDIQQVIDAHQLTSEDGIAGLYEFGESAINIRVTYYVQNLDWNDYIKTREGINYEIMEVLKRHNTSFAFPTRTVHLLNANR
jgi:MscS family membrane protein